MNPESSESELTDGIARRESKSALAESSFHLRDEIENANLPEIDTLPIIPTPTQKQLSEKQLVNYRAHREKLVRWMLLMGKNPDKGKGYSQSTVRTRCHYTDRFYRWVWNKLDQYTTNIEPKHGEKYIQHLMSATWETRTDRISQNR